jgi:hypothetical protein
MIHGLKVLVLTAFYASSFFSLTLDFPAREVAVKCLYDVLYSTVRYIRQGQHPKIWRMHGKPIQ